ncbi:hypothetical protein CSV67_00210 [Sporosarcina sp. P2]|uniref:hypothetical protein n=1 Tax=Sporosarcina sp. P2 TaxID=2048251 RepID=UPI000C165F98|nr:hypothetical protein [Sporosarcina sp. P2]PID03941.1 hypothetical protein CSV67_00210 [Sporosarcina sp. P2]
MYEEVAKHALGNPDIVVAVDNIGDGDSKFSSGSLRKELVFSLGSKAHRQMSVDAAVSQDYSQSHAEKLVDGDPLALTAGTIIKLMKSGALKAINQKLKWTFL